MDNIDKIFNNKMNRRQAEGIAILRSKNNGKGIGRPATIELDDTFKNVYTQWREKEITAV